MPAVVLNGSNSFEAFCQSVADQGQKVTQYVGDGAHRVGSGVLDATKYIGNSALGLAKKVGNSVAATAGHIADIKDDATAHSHLWKAVHAGFNALPTAKGELIATAGRSIAFLEAAQLVADFGDLMSGKIAKLNWNEIGQRVAFGFSNLGTTVLYAHELGIITASAKTAGTYLVFASGGAAVGYGMAAAEGAYRLLTLPEKHRVEIATKALLDSVAGLAGVALTTISLFGLVYSTVTIALLTLTCSLGGIVSFCYANSHKKVFAVHKLPESKTPGFWNNCSILVNETEGLEKVAKLFGKIADGISNAAVQALTADAKDFIELHELLNIFKRTKEWTVPEQNGDYFWSKTANSVWKITSKIFLSLLAVVTTIAFAIKYKFAELPAIAAATIGGVPFLALAAPAVFIGYTGCSFIDNAITMRSEYTENGGKYSLIKSTQKLAKWNKIASMINLQAVQNDVIESRNKRASDTKLSDAQRAALKAMDARTYTNWNFSRLYTHYNNASMRTHKIGLGLLSDGPKAVGAACGVGSMVAGITFASPVLAAQLGLAAGALSLAGAFTSLYKYVYDGEYNKPKTPVRIPAAAA